MKRTAESARRDPSHSRYAQLERERRFLLRALPADLSNPRRISDAYLAGTRLRLRAVTSDHGEVLARKLGQKVPIPGEPESVWLTNLYLDEAEAQALAALPARRICKRRWDWLLNGRVWAVDAFEGALAGLILAEVDVADRAALWALPPPPEAVAEVTEDLSFTGGALAAVSAGELEVALARWGLSLERPRLNDDR